MKIKYNLPMINKIKYYLNNTKEKIKIGKENKKTPVKYYTLLVLMLALGVISLTNNIKRYNKTNKESYNEYTLYENNNSNIVASNKVYLTAESSIYTTDDNMLKESDAVETISQNNDRLFLPVFGEIIKEYAIDKLVYSKTLGMWNTHPGIDIKADIGTDVISISDGKVIDIIYDEFYGNTIEIEDDTYLYKYSNLDNVVSLKIGDNVKKGDIIGSVGISAKGELQDDSHLHFEVLNDNSQINPLELLEFVE